MTQWFDNNFDIRDKVITGLKKENTSFEYITTLEYHLKAATTKVRVVIS